MEDVQVPSLLDPPSEEALTLFRTVLYARAATDGGWPVWQYVVLKLDAEGLDAYDVLRGLPTWGYNYRPVWIQGAGPGSTPALEHEVQLTLHGLVHLDDRIADISIRAFLAAVAEVAQMQSDISPRAEQPLFSRGGHRRARSAQSVGLGPPDLARMLSVSVKTPLWSLLGKHAVHAAVRVERPRDCDVAPALRLAPVQRCCLFHVGDGSLRGTDRLDEAPHLGLVQAVRVFLALVLDRHRVTVVADRGTLTGGDQVALRDGV